MRYIYVCIVLLATAIMLAGCSGKEEPVAESVEVADKEPDESSDFLDEGNSGTSRSPENLKTPEDQPPTHPPVLPPDMRDAEPVASKPSLPKKSSVSGVRQLDDSEAKLRICAVTRGRDGIMRVGVVLKGTDKGSLLRQNETFEGHKLLRYDETAKGAIFDYAGESVMISFSSTSSGSSDIPVNISSPEKAGMPGQQDKKETVNLALYNTVKYEQTPEEKASGIDPVDPKTWPKGYRGPTIERLIREQKMKEAGEPSQ